MKIVKPLTLGLLHKPYRYKGQNHFVIAAMGFFKLGDVNERFLTENLQWPKVVQALPVGRPVDEVMPKLRGEVLLAGHAYAPKGKPVAEMAVRVCVGGVDKRLRVIGEREWMYGLLPWYRVTQPQPFTRMPLVYERAFGGNGHLANPDGCGYARGRLPGLAGSSHGVMPNVEYPQTPVKAPWKRYRPAGFGAIDMRWEPRKNKHGTFDQRWLERDAPGLAENVDWSLFNVAPEDQWLPDALQGGECYRLEGVHPELPVIEGALPTAHARAFVLRQGKNADAAEEVPLRMDTVWFLPDHGIGIVIYHGQTGIDDSDALDISAVMIGYEHADAPKSLAHYREVLALRLDPETAGLHAFNEAQLAPQRSPEELARRAARHAGEQAALLARQQTMLDELDADFWAESGMPPPPGHTPAKAQLPALGTISEQAVEDGDFDLSEMMQQACALAEKAKAEGEIKLTEARAHQAELAPPLPPDPAAQKEAAFERASMVAYDLLPAPSAAMVHPEFAPLLQALDGAAQAGQPPDAAKLAQLRQTLLTLPALRRKGRNAAITPTAPAEALLPETAEWLGVQTAQWLMGGVCLAGRDLAGADLRGVDFSGADLREILLEQADLSGAKFTGANLAGAVFAGATLDGTDFSGANLANANFCHSKGTAIRFAGANLASARAIEAIWPQAELSDAVLDDFIAMKIDLTGATLDRAHVHRATLIEARADGSSWRGASIEKTVALLAALERANFSGASLHKAVLMDAKLHASVWIGATLKSIYGGGKADWSGADLREAKADACGWHGASFAGADLRDGHFLRCDFGQCDMSRADLRNGLFSRSLFMRSKLSNACAQDADFFQALCRKADFSCADLRRASLVQVEFSGALFTGACLDDLRLDKQRRAA
jgi:uncharacterized protein YjbI with pentapeptide repeats